MIKVFKDDYIKDEIVPLRFTLFTSNRSAKCFAPSSPRELYRMSNVFNVRFVFNTSAKSAPPCSPIVLSHNSNEISVCVRSTCHVLKRKTIDPIVPTVLFRKCSTRYFIPSSPRSFSPRTSDVTD